MAGSGRVSKFRHLAWRGICSPHLAEFAFAISDGKNGRVLYRINREHFPSTLPSKRQPHRCLTPLPKTRNHIQRLARNVRQRAAGAG